MAKEKKTAREADRAKKPSAVSEADWAWQLALEEFDWEGAKGALRDGADVNVKFSGYGDAAPRALNWAASQGHLEWCAWLLGQGADKDATDALGAKENVLMGQDACRTPLWNALGFGHFQCAQLFLEAGAQVAWGGFEEKNVWHLACAAQFSFGDKKSEAEAISFLEALKKKEVSGINHESLEQKAMPLGFALRSGGLARRDWLLANGANPGTKDTGRKTPLHWAALWGRAPDDVTALIKAGADVNARDEIEASALWHVANVRGKDNGAFEMAQALLEAGADPTFMDRGKNGAPAIHRAILTGNEEVFRALLNGPWKEKSLNIQDQEGKSALAQAASKGSASMCQALLLAGADWRVLDKKGRSALHHARDHGVTSIVHMLKSVEEGAQISQALDASESEAPRLKTKAL